MPLHEDRGALIERLPSPGGVALWLYALAFVLLPAVLAWKGFAFILGVVLFAVGLRPHVESLARGAMAHFGFNWRGKHFETDVPVSARSEKNAVRIVSLSLFGFTLLVVPFLAYVLQHQGRVFYEQLDTQLPLIVAQLQHLFDALHDRLPSVVPDVGGEVSSGDWKGLSSLLSQVAGDAAADFKIWVKKVSGDLLGLIGHLLGDWLKMVIGALIAGTMLASWEKEVKMHRGIISRGIRDARLRAHVLRYGELYQEGISLFMIGFLEVAATLSVLYVVAMIVLPLNLGLGAILFVGTLLGIVTAVPKIGGLAAMGIALLLMITRIEPGLGWFGYEIVSFGLWIDVLLRTALLMAAAKLMGLFEAYSFTPDVIGERLGLTKMQIIATVVIWAVGAGFFGMIWGILLSLTFQAALRLAQEVEQGDVPIPVEAGQK